jgi:hypothetical protein
MKVKKKLQKLIILAKNCMTKQNNSYKVVQSFKAKNVKNVSSYRNSGLEFLMTISFFIQN